MCKLLLATILGVSLSSCAIPTEDDIKQCTYWRDDLGNYYKKCKYDF